MNKRAAARVEGNIMFGMIYEAGTIRGVWPTLESAETAARRYSSQARGVTYSVTTTDGTAAIVSSFRNGERVQS